MGPISPKPDTSLPDHGKRKVNNFDGRIAQKKGLPKQPLSCFIYHPSVSFLTATPSRREVITCE
jgi:hypothetical protein